MKPKLTERQKFILHWLIAYDIQSTAEDKRQMLIEVVLWLTTLFPIKERKEFNEGYKKFLQMLSDQLPAVLKKEREDLINKCMEEVKRDKL